jgi:hypothetical protein
VSLVEVKGLVNAQGNNKAALKVAKPTRDDQRTLEKEIGTMLRVGSSPFIVATYGIAVRSDSSVLGLLMEVCEHGDLDCYIGALFYGDDIMQELEWHRILHNVRPTVSLPSLLRLRGTACADSLGALQCEPAVQQCRGVLAHSCPSACLSSCRV